VVFVVPRESTLNEYEKRLTPFDVPCSLHKALAHCPCGPKTSVTVCNLGLIGFNIFETPLPGIAYPSCSIVCFLYDPIGLHRSLVCFLLGSCGGGLLGVEFFDFLQDADLYPLVQLGPVSELEQNLHEHKERGEDQRL
jgi:hypothetical protein